MPFDDETLLSAYLDGELDPARRQMVESALRSSPALAGRLRDLARVRDAVRALGPSAMPKDLAPAILQNIRNISNRVARQAEARRAWKRAALILSPVVGVAAAVLIAWSMNGFGTTPEVPGPRVVERPDPPRPDPVEVVRADETPAPEPEAVKPDPPTPSPALVAQVDPEREKAVLGDQEILREILKQPEARQILIPVDVVDDASQQRVEDVIGLTAHAHPRHARMRLYQGVVIDPRHPDKAVIYAMVLDSTEAGNLKKNLAKSFPETEVTDVSVKPATLAQLTETVHLDVFETTPAGSILAGSPDAEYHHLARKSDADEPRTAVEDVAPNGFPPPGYPDLNAGTGHGPRRVREPEAGLMIAAAEPGRPEEEHQDAVYLVWLYERGKREDSRNE